jgi:spore coat protein CotH
LKTVLAPAFAITIAVVAVPAYAQDPLPSDELFNAGVVERLDIRLHGADWEKLKANFQENTYYPADIVFRGRTVHNTGIRSRGLGSRDPRKPGLRVDMDRYAGDQTFLGLKSFVLDNLAQDHSGVRETTAMKLFARLGIPAPREAFVRLYVRDVDIGLYAVVESIDKDFLARIYGKIGEDTQNDGYLYEYNYILGSPWRFEYLGPDLAPYKERFDPKTNESKSDADLYGPIENLLRLVNVLRPEELLPVLGEHLDLVAFVRYVAAQAFIGQNDGFLGYDGMNNFYFYRLENSSKHVFIAWDEDNAFAGHEFPIMSRVDENVLMSKAMQVPELRAEYNNMLVEASRISDEKTGDDGLGWLEFEVRRQLDLINQAMREDPSRPYSFDEHEVSRNLVIVFARERTRSVQSQRSATPLRRP